MRREKFAKGCHLSLDGDKERALKLFEEISAGEDKVILDYERAIIYDHEGETVRCEELLFRAMELNSQDLLCHIVLEHLYTETGQVSKPLVVIKRMKEKYILPEQAFLTQGEIHTMIQEDKNAIESYSRVLSSPRYTGEAARRLIPLMEKHGRFEESSYLTKKYT